MLIGIGAFRKVYDIGHGLVAKVEEGSNAKNVIEYEIWRSVDLTPWEKWFAPCYMISDDGKILIQAKVEFRGKKNYPKKIPKFLTDTKYSNYGWYKGQFVACDYASIAVLISQGLSHKFKKSNWWS